MKTKWLVLLATALSFPLLTGCSSDDDAGNPDNSKPVVKLTADYNATRTWLGDDNAIRWSATDKVSVNGSTSTNTVVSEEGAVATFEAPASSPYYAFYPASMVTSYDATAHTYVIAFPATQTYRNDVSFSEATNPAVAVSDNTYLTFSNVCGMLRMPINTNMAAAKARFICNENIAGAATVDPVNKTLTVTGTSKTIDIINLPQTIASYTLNWVLPVRTYTAGWKVQLLDVNDNILSEIVAPNPLTIERSKITPASLEGGAAIPFRYGIADGNLYWAKGNLYMPTTTTYAFASAQETYVNTYAGGYYFPYNCKTSNVLISNNPTSSWVAADDACAQMNPLGKWRVPTISELTSLYTNGSVWATKGGVNGRYFGLVNAPQSGEENNYVFLPAAGYRERNVATIVGLDTGCYMSQTFETTTYRILNFSSTEAISFSRGYNDRGEQIRCVSDK